MTQTPLQTSFNALLPFGLNASGGIGTTTSPNLKTTQHLQSLVSTEPGERVMLPTYGVPLGADLFGAYLDEEVSPAIINQITNSVAMWEPNVNVNGVTINPNVNSLTGASGAVEIDWSPSAIQSAAASGAITATVLVGGSVIEDGTSQ